MIFPWFFCGCSGCRIPHFNEIESSFESVATRSFGAVEWMAVPRYVASRGKTVGNHKHHDTHDSSKHIQPHSIIFHPYPSQTVAPSVISTLYIKRAVWVYLIFGKLWNCDSMCIIYIYPYFFIFFISHMANQLCGPSALKKSKPCPSFLRTKGCLQPGAVVVSGLMQAARVGTGPISWRNCSHHPRIPIMSTPD